jgi:hypothetical protein
LDIEYGFGCVELVMPALIAANMKKYYIKAIA